MAQRERRTEISEDQREILKSFFREGMMRVGSPLIPRAASATGLETCVIENWIGNYKRTFKASCEPRRSKLKLHTRELTPYNLFCRDLLRNKGTMNDIKGRWSTLGENEKQEYYEEAAALRAQAQAEDLSPEMRELKIKKHLKQLKLEVSKLEALGVETAIFSFDRHKCHKTYKLSSKGASSFLDTTNTANNFALHFRAGSSTATASPKDQVDVLVKRVQELFNQKYREAGGTGRLPYQSLLNQSMIINATGLPNGLTLRKPSFYGRKQLEAILEDAEHISFEIHTAAGIQTESEEELFGSMCGNDTAVGAQTESDEEMFESMCGNDAQQIKEESSETDSDVAVVWHVVPSSSCEQTSTNLLYRKW